MLHYQRRAAMLGLSKSTREGGACLLFLSCAALTLLVFNPVCVPCVCTFRASNRAPPTACRAVPCAQTGHHVSPKVGSRSRRRAKKGQPPVTGHELGAQDQLDRQLLLYAANVLPWRNDTRVKTKLYVLHRVEKAARKVLGADARVACFGSSANGCGEVEADLDLVVFDEDGACDKKTLRPILRKLAFACAKETLIVEQLILSAKVPIIALRTRGNCSCDVSCNNILPTVNTRLLRAYSMLEPWLTLLTVVVKRFAKSMGIASTHDGFISSYAWTLMVVYYFQVCHGLPSLHDVAMRGGAEGADLQSGFAPTFASHSEVRAEWKVRTPRRPGELLKRFFSFYADEFDWTREVVSVRLGDRVHIDSGEFAQKLQKGGVGRLYIEDPIQISRNLNFALSPERAEHIQNAIKVASANLNAGGGLPDEMLENLPSSLPGGWTNPRRMLKKLDGYLKVPDLLHSFEGSCVNCGLRMKYADLLVHESRCNKRGLGPTSSNPYSCACCGKAFRLPVDLEQHHNATGHSGTVALQSSGVLPDDDAWAT